MAAGIAGGEFTPVDDVLIQGESCSGPKCRIAQDTVILADKQTIMGDAENLEVKFPPHFIEAFKISGDGAHVVEMVTVDGDDVLGEVQGLVHGMHVARQHMEK